MNNYKMTVDLRAVIYRAVLMFKSKDTLDTNHMLGTDFASFGSRLLMHAPRSLHTKTVQLIVQLLRVVFAASTTSLPVGN